MSETGRWVIQHLTTHNLCLAWIDVQSGYLRVAGGISPGQVSTEFQFASTSSTFRRFHVLGWLQKLHQCPSFPLYSSPLSSKISRLECLNFEILSLKKQDSCLCFLIFHYFSVKVVGMMGRKGESNRGKLRERLLKHFSKRLRGDHEDNPPRMPVANIELRTDVTDPSSPSAEDNSVSVPSPEQMKQDCSQMGLWMRAANSLGPRDREQLGKIIRSKRNYLDGREPDLLAEEVNSTLSRAEQLKMEGKESSWGPVSPFRPR